MNRVKLWEVTNNIYIYIYQIQIYIKKFWSSNTTTQITIKRKEKTYILFKYSAIRLTSKKYIIHLIWLYFLFRLGQLLFRGFPSLNSRETQEKILRERVAPYLMIKIGNSHLVAKKSTLDMPPFLTQGLFGVPGGLPYPLPEVSMGP